MNQNDMQSQTCIDCDKAPSSRYLSKLHLIHSFTSVPVKESFTAEHGSELLRDSFEKFLNCGAVSNEGRWHLQASWWDVTDSCFDIVGDPFNKVAAVFVLHIQHLLVDLFHWHSSTEHSSHCKVTAMTRITCCHHVFSIKHLLSEFRNCKSTILLWATAGQWSKSRHEEVETWERDHVHS